jgi:hypothetical protein
MLDDELRESAASLNELADADKVLKEELTDTTEALKTNTEEFEANAETLAKYGITLEEYTEATKGMTEAEKEQYNALFLVEGELNNLAAAHDAAYQSAYDNINGQIGLFEEMSSKPDKSIKDLIKALDSQIKYMDTYAANIKKAMELGVDKGLVQKLSDGSQESAKILAAIVKDGGKNIEELNEKFGKVEEGKKEFAGTVADMETDFKNSINAINAKLDHFVKDMDKSAAAASAAKNTGGSYASGLLSKRTAVYNASAALAKASNQGWKDYYQQHSPSKVAIDEAAQTADSYAMGFEQRIKHMEDTTKKFALASNDAYSDTMKEITLKATPILYDLSGLRRSEPSPIAKGGDINISIDARGMTVRSDADIKKISQGLADEVARKISARGGRIA